MKIHACFSIEGNSVRCNYIPRDQRAKETIGQLKAAVKQVSEVVLATDPDREGETIAWHLKEVLGLREPKRVVYTEITASAVTSAIALSQKVRFKFGRRGTVPGLLRYTCERIR